MERFRTTAVYPAEVLSKAVNDTIKWHADREILLQNRVKELETNAKKVMDERLIKEIEELRSRLSMSYGEFSSKKEKDAYEEFVKKHMHDRATSKYNGGRAPYLIPTGVGVGTNLKVKCPICEAVEDITDTEVW